MSVEGFEIPPEILDGSVESYAISIDALSNSTSRQLSGYGSFLPRSRSLTWAEARLGVTLKALLPGAAYTRSRDCQASFRRLAKVCHSCLAETGTELWRMRSSSNWELMLALVWYRMELLPSVRACQDPSSMARARTAAHSGPRRSDTETPVKTNIYRLVEILMF